MTIQQIREKYWVEFLIWYKDYKDALVLSINSFESVPASTEDLFWYWLTHIRSREGDKDFINRLGIPAEQAEEEKTK